ncbi:hypothetical protein MB02_10220 [Croceicoccus estronivorus]|uniref:Zn-ribbon domain-containing OB-fold protein n=1 Tax=Croceicoccus estronivorus TaxID=1172626 RepID=UPI00082DFFFE|nr:OB-fold domain-containing protein [Croceicoccus estronivorus]OCC23546.1 hypothetical protein MB02_10220 [Croceicoccus estronivorus]
MMSKDDAFFWEGAQEGRLLLRSCASCGEIAHPPLPMCPHCHGLEWGTVEASGRGTVYAWLCSKHPNQADDKGRIVVLVDLEEGVRLVSNLLDTEIDEVTAGAPVAVTFVEVDGQILPQFRMTGDSA